MRELKRHDKHHLHPVRLHMTTDTNHKFRAHASVTTSQDFHGVQDNFEENYLFNKRRAPEYRDDL